MCLYTVDQCSVTNRLSTASNSTIFLSLVVVHFSVFERCFSKSLILWGLCQFPTVSVVAPLFEPCRLPCNFARSPLSVPLLVLLTCLSLFNTQARALNLIHAVLCDDEGVTQARGC